MLEPRVTAPDAWKRWLKTSAQLTGRLWLSALPLSLIVGGLVGWGLRETHHLLGLVILPLTGLWQVVMLGLAERAAQGKRVTVGDAWESVADFCLQRPALVLQQMKARFVLGLAVLAAFLVIMGGVMALRWLLEPPAAVVPLPVSPPGLLLELSFFASNWALVWVWTWGIQSGGLLSGVQTLVRKHGLAWGEALPLWQKAARLNQHNLKFVLLPGFLLGQTMVFFPYLGFLIFPLEIFWACLVAVVMRDIFDQKDALDPQEARVTTTQASTALG